MMTPLRVGVALLLVGLVCLTVVVLRAERVRLEARAQEHLVRLLECRRAAWNIQVELARLRAPQQIRERVAWFDLALERGFDAPPGQDAPVLRYARNGR